MFSKHTKKSYKEQNIEIYPISNDAFIESMINCTGMLCGAGFETPAEILFLKKKLMAIPMKGQYEQQCNAAALETLGVPIIKSLKEKHVEKIKAWTTSKIYIGVNYPNITEKIIDELIAVHGNISIKNIFAASNKNDISLKKFKGMSRYQILKKVAE